LMVSFQYYFLLVGVSALLTAILTPVVIRSAIKYDIVDHPGFHKTHKTAKPLLGGLTIYLSFMITFLIFLPFNGKLTSIIIATAILVLTGYYDDTLSIKPLTKLSGQVAAAAVVVFYNYERFFVLHDFFARYGIPTFITLFLILGWIVLMINAFNLIDGLDGLAVGVGAIILLSMAFNTYLMGGSIHILSLQLICLGACVGFLPFNFNPASQFMGDTGSMLLGFLLSLTFLFSITSPFSSNLVVSSAFIFAYPALDVSYAVYRRLRGGCSIFKADRCHIHHVIRSLGFSVRQTVLIIYGINAFFAGLGVTLLYLNLSAYIMTGIGVITALAALLVFRYLARLSKQHGLLIH